LANGYETSYGNPATTCTLYTLIPGLATGQLQSITLPAASISGSFLIATVQVTVDHNVLVWQYTAFGGANIGDSITGLVQFINRGQTSAGITKPVPVITVGYHEITIDHTKIVGSDKTNFVFFFGGVYEWLTGPPGGNVAYANGSDIFFSSDRAGSEVLDFDLEMYDSGTGQIAAWVRIPTVSHTVDTVIYIQYGDTVSADQTKKPQPKAKAQERLLAIQSGLYSQAWELREGNIRTDIKDFAAFKEYFGKKADFLGNGGPGWDSGQSGRRGERRGRRARRCRGAGSHCKASKGEG